MATVIIQIEDIGEDDVKSEYSIDGNQVDPLEILKDPGNHPSNAVTFLELFIYSLAKLVAEDENDRV